MFGFLAKTEVLILVQGPVLLDNIRTNQKREPAPKELTA